MPLDSAPSDVQAHATEERDQDLLRCIHSLLRGDYTVTPASELDELSKAMAALCRGLQAGMIESTDRVVETCSLANETGIGLARLRSTSQEVNVQSQSIAAAVEEMVASVQTISSTTQAVVGDAADVQRAATSGVHQVRSAIQVMQQIAVAVKRTSERVSTLHAASQQIGQIVKAIDAIASQTHMLALNATIEAARAGDAGRGFAVVAHEVKNLSQETARATEEIRERIDNLRTEMNGIVDSMNEGAKAVESGQAVITAVGTEIETVGIKVDHVTSRMSEVANVLGQQSQASNEVAQGVSAIALLASQNLERFERVSTSMETLEGAVGAQITEVAAKEFPGKVVRLAKADHIIWKKRLVAMSSGRLTLKADELSDHRSCRLGKWYYSEAAKPCHGEPAFAALERPHTLVHEHGKKAARHFEVGRLDDALASIEEVEAASVDVLRLLNELC